jgi:hypothetical protein
MKMAAIMIESPPWTPYLSYTLWMGARFQDNLRTTKIKHRMNNQPINLSIEHQVY